MRAICRLAGAIAALATMSSAGSVYSQETKELPVPNVTVTAPAAPVEPPYLRNPWKSYQRNPYAGRYAWRRINSRRCHVRRHASHLRPVASVYRVIGWCRETLCCTKAEASNATWRSTWSCTKSATCRSKPAH